MSEMGRSPHEVSAAYGGDIHSGVRSYHKPGESDLSHGSDDAAWRPISSVVYRPESRFSKAERLFRQTVIGISGLGIFSMLMVVIQHVGGS